MSSVVAFNLDDICKPSGVSSLKKLGLRKTKNILCLAYSKQKYEVLFHGVYVRTKSHLHANTTTFHNTTSPDNVLKKNPYKFP